MLLGHIANSQNKVAILHATKTFCSMKKKPYCVSHKMQVCMYSSSPTWFQGQMIFTFLKDTEINFIAFILQDDMVCEVAPQPQ